MNVISKEQNNEAALITRAIRGDADAFCSLYGLYRTRLYRYAFYRLRSEADAEDAVSECVLSAWRQIGSLREPEAFPAWIFRILSGTCSRLIRQQIGRREQVSLDDPAGGVSVEQLQAAGDSAPLAGGRRPDAADADTWLILQEALTRLSDEERNIVLLSAAGGLKSREIAELTGRPDGTVRSTLSRSLKKIRGYFE